MVWGVGVGVGVYAHVMALVHRSEDILWDLVLSFTTRVPGIKLGC